MAIKYIYVLIAVGAIFAVASFSYFTFIATPRYTATGSILATNGAIVEIADDTTDENINNSDIVASINFANTVTDTLKTNGAYKKVSNAIDGKLSYANLKAISSVKRRDDKSLFIDISFTASSPQVATRLVNEYLAVAPDYLNECIPNIKVAVFNADSAGKTYPPTITYTLVAAIIGAALAFALILFFHINNSCINDEEEFREWFNVPLLGSVPDFSKAGSNKYYYYSYYSKNKGDVKNEDKEV